MRVYLAHKPAAPSKIPRYRAWPAKRVKELLLNNIAVTL
jgi:hypothetical protein